jgi:predicted Zn-dependent protease
MDPDELAQLAALGYLSATSQPAIDVDPRDVIERIPLLWRSRQLLSDGKLDLADTAIKRLEQLLPDAAGVVTLRADWLSASGQPEEAYERLIHVFTRAPGPQLAMSLGRLAEELGAPDAESWYREALLAVPGLPEALAGLARLALADGDLAEAEALSLQLAGESPDAVEVNLMLAEASLARGELALAEREARAALVKRPLHPWALDLLARVTWERGRPEEALELTFDLLRERPTDGVVRARLSRWLLDVGRAAEALRVLRNARSTADQVPEFARLRGEAEAMLGLPPSEPVEP